VTGNIKKQTLKIKLYVDHRSEGVLFNLLVVEKKKPEKIQA